MTTAAPGVSPSFRFAFHCAWPAMLLAAVLLLPFLNTPFTIDDPIYLKEAQNVLSDPLHPQAFNIVWSTDRNLRASQILPGGVAVPYLLVPTALLGCPEWAGHLTQLLFLLAALWATSMAALRLGLDGGQARMAAILTASCPAALGMAGTVMPDIAAMLFSILSMERLMAWSQVHRLHQGLSAACWLALAALTRTHTILLLAPAFVLVFDGCRKSLVRLWPLALAPAIFLAVSTLTADPEAAGDNIVSMMFSLPGGVALLIHNAAALLAHWLLVIPLTLAWLVLRIRQIPASWLLIAAAAGTMLSLRLGWVAFADAATLLAMADIAWDALRRRDRVQMALWVWLWLALPVVIYIQLPSKYLLPSVPAAALLIVRLNGAKWLIPGLAAAGAVLGLLILLATRDLAETQRHAVAELIEPHILAGQRTWFAGHWGFQWYAEAAGASPVTLEPPWPKRGDLIVVSEIDRTLFARQWAKRKVLQRVPYTGSGIGRVMDLPAGVGFFSSAFGYLPWRWGHGDEIRFEVWEVE